MLLEETCISGILGCGLGLNEGFVPGSCGVGGGRGFGQNLAGLAGSSVQVA